MKSHALLSHKRVPCNVTSHTGLLIRSERFLSKPNQARKGRVIEETHNGMQLYTLGECAQRG